MFKRSGILMLNYQNKNDVQIAIELIIANINEVFRIIPDWRKVSLLRVKRYFGNVKMITMLAGIMQKTPAKVKKREINAVNSIFCCGDFEKAGPDEYKSNREPTDSNTG